MKSSSFVEVGEMTKTLLTANADSNSDSRNLRHKGEDAWH